MMHIKYRPKSWDEVIGNDWIKKSIMLLTYGRPILFEGCFGCVDGKTEFLSRTGWKSIDSYSDTDHVLQYNLDGSAEFVIPKSYIVQPTKGLYRFKTKYGLDQCLSLNHKVLYRSRKSGNFLVDIFSNIIERHIKNKAGFNGQFITTFKPTLDSKLCFSDRELRVMVMVVADGSFSKSGRCSINVKKQRKKDRATMLLQAAGIEYKTCNRSNGYSSYGFYPPIKTKKFDEEFYKASFHQLQVIEDEIYRWDGWNDGKVFYTTSKKSADFIQYVLTSLGFRSSINIDRRDKRTDCYGVHRTKLIYPSMTNATNSKCNISEFTNHDGNEYCFEVDSGFLVLRRNNKIFITGNCGKTTFAYIVAKEWGANELTINEVNCVYYSKVEDMRKLIETTKKSSLFGKKRVLILNEIHKLSDHAEQIFLVELEENGFSDDVLVLACTTSPEEIKSSALLSRFIRYRVQTLTNDESLELINHVCKSEGITLSKSIKAILIDKSMGIPRLILTGLPKIVNAKSDKEVKYLLEVNATSSEVDADTMHLFNIILKSKTWYEIIPVLKNLSYKKDPNSTRIGLLNLISGMLTSDFFDGDMDRGIQLLKTFDYLKSMDGVPARANLIASVYFFYKTMNH